MTHRNVALRGAGILVVVLALALAGCAAPTPVHTATASTPAPKVTPTPTPTAASKAGSRVPIGCASLLDSPSWSALAGSTARLDRDENTAPTDMTSIAQLQFGALTCIWDGDYSSSSTTPGSELEVDVAPDSATEFESSFARIMGDQTVVTHPTATENVAGQTSGFWCANNVGQLGADADLAVCDGELLVGGYWVSITVGGVQDLTRPQLMAAIPAAMTEIAAKLTAAGAPVAQWVAPASTPPAFCTAATSTTAVRSILGNSTLALVAPQESLGVVASTVGRVGPWASCFWQGKSSASALVTMLAGGSWAIPGLVPVFVGESPFAGQKFAPVAVAGATSAIIAVAGGECAAFMVVGSTAVEVEFESLATAKNTAALAAFAAAISAT